MNVAALIEIMAHAAVAAVERQESRLRIAKQERLSHAIRRNSEQARQGQRRGQRVRERAQNIRRKENAGEHPFELRHFVRREFRVGRLQRGERVVEIFNALSIATPMQDLLREILPIKIRWRDDVLQRLRDHRAFHRMENSIRIRHQTAGGIAEVPCQPVAARIHVARRARRDAQPARLARVIKMPPPLAHDVGRGIEHGNVRDEDVGRRIDDRDARRKSVPHVEPRTRGDGRELKAPA